MARTAAEIAAHIGAQLDGNPAAPVAGIAAPDSASAQDLIYVDSPRFLDGAQASAAVCVITSAELRVSGKTQLITAQPKLAFAKASAWLLPPRAIAAGVHATAVVDATAQLGPGVAIGPYAVVEAGAKIGAESQIGAHCVVGAGSVIGENCRLHARVTLYPGARLGQRVIVHSGAVIGSDGFGYVFGDGRFWPFPQAGQAQLDDDVEIGANATVDRGSLGETRIGQGSKLDNLVHVAHNVRIGRHTVVAAQTGISGSSTVGDGVLIGGQVGIADHCEIENGAILGAQKSRYPHRQDHPLGSNRVGNSRPPTR